MGKFQQLHEQYLAKEAAYNNGELPAMEFIKFLKEQGEIYRHVANIREAKSLEELKVLKVVVEPSGIGPGKYCLSVAIESAPGYWKAYTGIINHFPTAEDVKRVANTGSKISVQLHAEHIIGKLLQMKFDG